ncbi:MAG: hypothetical protein H0U76_07760 [Ktedonobacteraceae bacterium]|nr:hypothetical protein [Ktedonobacteraceae bacterium]MBA3825817.1 hypothetical protein [Ktedonobacterales bacterium]
MATPQPQPPSQQQPIYPRDLNLELDRLYNRVTTYFDARFDKIMTEIRVMQADIRTMQEDIVEIKTVQQQMQGDITEIKTEQRQMQGQVATLESFQKTMMEASKAQTMDLLQIIQNLHAQTMGAINDLRPKNME